MSEPSTAAPIVGRRRDRRFAVHDGPRFV